jgi:parallel beta-helix repeat protein
VLGLRAVLVVVLTALVCISAASGAGRRAAVIAAACHGVTIRVGANLQRAVDAHPAGTTFCLAPGVHRMTGFVVPKDRNRFLGSGVAVLDGSELLGGFVRSGSYWLTAGPVNQNPEQHGQCTGGGKACLYANDVFFDGRPLRRVLSLDEVGPQTFYYDPGVQRTYIGRNPAGHAVAAAVATRAFKGWGSGAEGVLVRGLVVQHFANEGGAGAINGRPTWRVIGNVVRWNHGVGVQDASVIRNNKIYENGQLGIMGSFNTGSVIEGNLIRRNNYAGFDPAWEAGGAKWVKSRRLLIRGNTVDANRGPGLWCDTDCSAITYDRNTVVGNSGPGIFHEVSYEATISNNVVRRNGFGAGGWLDGAGILLSNSAGVDVTGNVVSLNRDGIGITQTDRGSGARGTYRSQDDVISGNTVTMVGGHTGLVQNVGDPTLYTSAHIQFRANRYRLGCSNAYFAWRPPAGRSNDVYVSWAAWRSAGNDLDGSVKSLCKS